MLVSFSVSNFRSFDGEQTFSLVASKEVSSKHEGHAVAIPDSDGHVLRTGVIYGANGSGKSNLFKALRLLKNIATSARNKDAPIRRDAFRFGREPSQLTGLDLQFILNERLYRYGVTLDDVQIREEWLARVSHGNQQLLYERMVGPKGEVQVELGDTLEAQGKFRALAQIGGPRNQSFLETVFTTLDVDEIPSEIVAIYLWFYVSLRLISPQSNERNVSRIFTTDRKLLEFAGNFLRSSSTGVERLEVVELPLTEEEFEILIPDEPPDISSLSEGESWERSLANGDVVSVQKSSGFRYFRSRLQAVHRTNLGEFMPLEIQQESDGTRRLLQLLPALHNLKQSDFVYFIDEVDRSLHPMLVRTFLEFFLNSCEGGERQLLMTTHESSLLDQDLLRRDEIWFAEKDAAGATSLYSLLDFKVRNDLEIRKHYMQGRFGAIPFLGGAERLIEKEGQPA